VYVEAGYPWFGADGPDIPGMAGRLDVEEYFRCCQKMAAARNAARRPKGSPTASPTVRAVSEHDACVVALGNAVPLLVDDADGVAVAVVVTVAVP
jgi:hypothetical protein